MIHLFDAYKIQDSQMWHIHVHVHIAQNIAQLNHKKSRNNINNLNAPTHQVTLHIYMYLLIMDYALKSNFTPMSFHKYCGMAYTCVHKHKNIAQLNHYDRD